MSVRRSIDLSLKIPSFVSLRVSICAVLGLSTAACGGNVIVESSGGGGSSSGVGSVSGPSSGTGTVSSVVCEGAVPVAQPDGSWSGYNRCPDGTVHRVEAIACVLSVPQCDFLEDSVSCTSDADCNLAPNGKCGHSVYADETGSSTSCGCIYPCSTDQDCGDGQVCVCTGVVATDTPWPTCAVGGCITGDDCATQECGIAPYSDGCATYPTIACRLPTDPCRSSDDCPDLEQCVGVAWDSYSFSCQGSNCAIGRPLLVSGKARTAVQKARSDWADPTIAPRITELTAHERAALAAYWQEVAALEHASIASFARFSLELLSLGAPPDLLVDTQRAAADEVRHARMAYALLSAFGGAAAGPSRLDLTGVAPSTDVTAIVRALVTEACVGETIGAAEARALADMVEDRALSAAYRQIAEDEARHAELGWRTLSWLVTKSPFAGAELRDVAQSAFEQAIATMGKDPEVAAKVVAPELGLLSGAGLGAIRRQALREVVAPCAQALLSR